MNGFWLDKFEELAKFNADEDKSKYNDSYLEKMKIMQKEEKKMVEMYSDKQRCSTVMQFFL